MPGALALDRTCPSRKCGCAARSPTSRRCFSPLPTVCCNVASRFVRPCRRSPIASSGPRPGARRRRAITSDTPSAASIDSSPTRAASSSPRRSSARSSAEGRAEERVGHPGIARRRLRRRRRARARAAARDRSRDPARAARGGTRATSLDGARPALPRRRAHAAARRPARHDGEVRAWRLIPSVTLSPRTAHRPPDSAIHSHQETACRASFISRSTRAIPSAR